MWKWALTPLFSHTVWISDKSKNDILGITSTPSAFPTFASDMSIFGMGVPSVVPAGLFTVTPYPTNTPYPTYTPVVVDYPLSNFQFSFYDPMIGLDKPEIAELNCGDWNYSTNYCDSPLRNGEPWEQNYLKAAACPYDLYVAGAQFEVVSPDWLHALFPLGFVCKDTGELVIYPYIDFLIPWRSMPMPYENTPWTTPITLRRLR